VRTSLVQQGLSILSVGILFAAGACTTPTRGTFGSGSCSSPIDVYAGAASAIYFDIHMNPLGDRAEDLTGTVKNKMCPTPVPHPIGPDPSACNPPPGYCAKTIAGKTYCLRCP
jgi:hypothetical protein